MRVWMCRLSSSAYQHPAGGCEVCTAHRRTQTHTHTHTHAYTHTRTHAQSRPSMPHMLIHLSQGPHGCACIDVNSEMSILIPPVIPFVAYSSITPTTSNWTDTHHVTHSTYILSVRLNLNGAYLHVMPKTARRTLQPKTLANSSEKSPPKTIGLHMRDTFRKLVPKSEKGKQVILIDIKPITYSSL